MARPLPDRRAYRRPSLEEHGHSTALDKLALAFYWAPVTGAAVWTVYSPESAKTQVILLILVAGLIIGSLLDHLSQRGRVNRAAEMAYHDELTRTPNRRHFMESLQVALKREPRGQTTCAVLFLDLDRFKLINDTLGHPTGDLFLIAVADRLSAIVAGRGMLARFGGDEFAILLESTNREQVESFADRLLNELNTELSIGTHVLWPNGSIGIALAEVPRPTAVEMIRRADVALYQAKLSGGARYSIFSAAVISPLRAFSLEHELRFAIQRNEMQLYYQPVIDLRTLRLKGFEALVRWQHPRLGLLGPAEFVSLAEETGMIQSLGRWIVAEACRQTSEWHRLYGQHLTVSINLSALEFRQVSFLTEFSNVLSHSQVGRESVQIEITETAFMENEETTIQNLIKLKALGVKVAIDDFGIGYSSLSYLQRFDVDVLKIDQSFVRSLEDSRGRAITEAIVRLGHSLGMTVVAEGVENDEQLARLQEAHCDLGQGYLFSHPLTAADSNALLATIPLLETVQAEKGRAA